MLVIWTMDVLDHTTVLHAVHRTLSLLSLISEGLSYLQQKMTSNLWLLYNVKLCFGLVHKGEHVFCITHIVATAGLAAVAVSYVK
jgi:hypothetical protein